MTQPAVTSVDSLQCNIARATIITDLNEFSILLQKIDTSNETVALAVSDARDGLKTAGDCDHVDSTGFNCRRRYRSHVASFDSTEPAASDALSKLDDAAAAAAEVGGVCRHLTRMSAFLTPVSSEKEKARRYLEARFSRAK
ncbi:hypothetical protein Moror_13458 [Moniliophthora roreri MCA 2997]|uniref:Uncharacterized protein n=1 Tax=Moniliophthora roreri (strain MCA 2997) TaxID=1381753 RepID=V2XN69_MONRO|nr:hypothetical protein Moror_13458 [Moniliophthora roreri MCA 2997]